MGTGLVATDHFEWKKVKPYLIYVGMFVATIYTNMRALQHSNVETIIVFRAVSAARLQRIKPHAKLSSRFSLSLFCAVLPARRLRPRLGLPRPPAPLATLDVRLARRRRRLRGLRFDRPRIQAQWHPGVQLGLRLFCDHLV